MRVVQINTVNYGSTGGIMIGIADALKSDNEESFICYPNCRSKKRLAAGYNEINTCGIIAHNIHILLSYLTGMEGCYGIISTAAFLKKIKQIKPDIVHLHNLHNGCINLPLLFSFLKKNKIKVVWTLHDCWGYTGHCTYYSYANCSKWKNGCHGCQKFKMYPKTLFDNSRRMFELKKRVFTSLNAMKIVCPSNWLKEEVEKSFLGKYDIQTVYNGIDCNMFYPQKSIKQKYKFPDKKIILGVSDGWSKRKGIDTFIRLAAVLPSEYVIVLVGTDEETEKGLPSQIHPVRRTRDKKELAEYYSMADVFLNPTKEEVLGLVNLEALACGTPVITFNSGGSPECIDETCGIVVEPTIATEELLKIILNVVDKRLFSEEQCRKRALCFKESEKSKEYLLLYSQIMKEKWKL